MGMKTHLNATKQTHTKFKFLQQLRDTQHPRNKKACYGNESTLKCNQTDTKLLQSIDKLKLLVKTMS